MKGRNISIDAARGVRGEYIITDSVGITIGRMIILDLSKSNSFSCLRIRFYKQGQMVFKLIKETLEVFLEYLFKEMNINKVSILVDEEISVKPFVELGFTLEGIISKSIVEKNIYKDEMIFGIENRVYNGNRTINVLRLYGKNIVLKVLTPEDANSVLQYYIKNKDYLKPFEPSREEDFYTFEVQKEIIIENYKQFLNGVSINFGIYKGGIFIGKIQVSNITYGVFKSAAIGYSIDEDYQGKGYMKEAVSLIEDYAFNEMELHRIEASTLVDNVKSQGVLLGRGFKELGVNEKYLFINGKWMDHITFYKINQ